MRTAAVVASVALLSGCASAGRSAAPAGAGPGGVDAVNAYRAKLGANTTPGTAPGTGVTGNAGAPTRAPAGGAAGSLRPAHPIPASFGVAAGAPSDREVRRELAQLRRIQHTQQALLAQYSPAAADFANLLPWREEKKTNQISIASVFTDYGLGIACGGVLGRDQIGVAHKTAPCGTIVDFIYGNRELQVPVIDRGPYIAGREWDLTGAAAAALQFPGLGPIRWSVVG